MREDLLCGGFRCDMEQLGEAFKQGDSSSPFGFGFVEGFIPWTELYFGGFFEHFNKIANETDPDLVNGDGYAGRILRLTGPTRPRSSCRTPDIGARHKCPKLKGAVVEARPELPR